MNATTRFLASNGVTRMYDAGCVVLKSNDPNGSTMHVGGTKYVKVSGTENGSLQEISTGLNLTVKGGLISKGKVDLQFDLSSTGSVTAGEGDSFDQQQSSIKNSAVCELDNTVVLGGYKKIVQDTSRSGLPILRNTPVLKWFVSQDNDNSDDDNLIMLACPRIQKDSSQKLELPVIDEVTKETDRAKQDGKEILKEDRAKRKGWWVFW